jgi:hypothetical protein
MVAISATNSATPSLQLALGSNKLAQAKREADQAEAKAQNLRSQADAAEVEAQKSKDRVRDLSARPAPTDPTYPHPAQAVKSVQSNFLLDKRLSGNPLSAPLKAAPVQNSQGQTTGRIVNVSA